MRVVLLCATQRGYRCLQKLTELLPNASLVVFSFREEPWEPPFLEDIRALTLSSGGQFFETKNVGGDRLSSFWDSTPVDLMLVVSWRYLIPSKIYLRPIAGAFVFHDSLLPEYRGFAPTVWAIINGEERTGVTLFVIGEDVDAGDIVDQKSIPIRPDSTISEVMEQVTETYIDLLEVNLGRLLSGKAPRRKQDHSRATFTCKRVPQDNKIDWTQSSANINNLIRATGTPYPGAFTFVSGKKLIVWSAQLLKLAPRYVGRIPGKIVEVKPGEGSLVLTGDGCLLLKEVEIEGGSRACASEILKRLGEALGN